VRGQAAGQGGVCSQGPVRTCIGCRRRAGKADLVRLVQVSGHVVIDHAQSLPGRGAYVHLDRRCVQAAGRSGRAARALRTAGPLALSALEDLQLPVRPQVQETDSMSDR